MNTTFNVRFGQIQKKPGRRRPYGVRWVTDKKEHSSWFANKTPAEFRRTELMRAAREGQEFDIDSGLPLSELKRQNSALLLEVSKSYLDMKWPRVAATSRAGIVDGLASACAAFVKPDRGQPELRVLRRALICQVLPPPAREQPIPPEHQEAVSWLERHSRPIYDLTDLSVVRELLDALTLKLDGTPVSAKLYRRKRSAVFNMLDYAVEETLLPDNPIRRVKHSVSKPVAQVDPGVVVSSRQARELLTAVSYSGRRDPERGARLVAFFATLYYAAARPAEAMALRDTDCTLPRSGWGELALGQSLPYAGKRWTDTGDVHDRRGLKHRPPNEIRYVPIPPVHVAILRHHLATFGTTEDGRLFRAASSAPVQSSTYGRIWQDARRYALPDAERNSRLATVPYDLRHAGVSLWLNSGVPPTEVAARAGHSVDVLLKVYAKCIHGQRDRLNSLIDAALDDQ